MIEDILSEANNLGEATADSTYQKPIQDSVNSIFKNSFLKTYKSVGLFSAFLAFLSGLIAILTFKRN